MVQLKVKKTKHDALDKLDFPLSKLLAQKNVVGGGLISGPRQTPKASYGCFSPFASDLLLASDHAMSAHLRQFCDFPSRALNLTLTPLLSLFVT